MENIQDRIQDFFDNYPDNFQCILDFRGKDIKLKLQKLDVLLHWCLFTPLIVLFWHGTWGLLDSLCPNESSVYAAWILLICGISVELGASIFQEQVAILATSGSELQAAVVMRIYNYVIAVANICHYKAIHDLFSIYKDTGWYNSIGATTTSIIALWGLQCSHNILGPPLYFDIDPQDNYDHEAYSWSTIFNTEQDLSPGSLLDSFCSVVVVLSLVNWHWIGVWSLLDNLLGDDNQLFAMAAAMLLGYSLTLSFLNNQKTAKNFVYALSRQNRVYRTLFEKHIYMLLANMSCITLWYGYWCLFDIFAEYFPIRWRNMDVTPLMTHLCAFILLALSNCTNSLTTKGVEFDREAEEGDCMLFEIKYLQTLFKDAVEDNESESLSIECPTPAGTENGGTKLFNGSVLSKWGEEENLTVTNNGSHRHTNYDDVKRRVLENRLRDSLYRDSVYESVENIS